MVREQHHTSDHRPPPLCPLVQLVIVWQCPIAAAYTDKPQRTRIPSHSIETSVSASRGWSGQRERGSAAERVIHVRFKTGVWCWECQSQVQVAFRSLPSA